MSKETIARIPSSRSNESDEVARSIERAEEVSVTATLTIRLIAIRESPGKVIGKLRVISMAAYTILQIDAVSPLDSRKLQGELAMLEDVHGWNVRSQEGKVEVLRVLENPSTFGSQGKQSLIALEAIGFGAASLGDA